MGDYATHYVRVRDQWYKDTVNNSYAIVSPIGGEIDCEIFCGPNCKSIGFGYSIDTMRAILQCDPTYTFTLIGTTIVRRVTWVRRPKAAEEDPPPPYVDKKRCNLL